MFRLFQGRGRVVDIKTATKSSLCKEVDELISVIKRESIMRERYRILNIIKAVRQEDPGEVNNPVVLEAIEKEWAPGLMLERLHQKINVDGKRRRMISIKWLLRKGRMVWGLEK